MKVKLDKKTHTYSTKDGEHYKSVSALIEQFVPFFDFEQKSYDYSLKHGIPVEEVRFNWREKNRLSTTYGQEIHTVLEESIKNRKFTHEKGMYDDVLKKIGSFCNKKDKILSEQIIYNEEFKIAGTTDLIIERKDDFDILDFKTNKKIKFDNPYSESHLLFPLNNIPNAEYFKYSIQLSLYAYMHELLTGKNVYRLMIFWFKRLKPEDYTCYEGEWLRYSLPYLKEEVKLILEYGSRK